MTAAPNVNNRDIVNPEHWQHAFNLKTCLKETLKKISYLCIIVTEREQLTQGES